MSKTFISYRRSDSADQAGRIFDRLAASFSKSKVFKDVDSIPAGSDFRRVIKEAVEKSDIVVVIIGPNWLTAVDERGRRRLDDENDFVRFELEVALALEKVVIPVLVRNGSVPHARDLPPTIREIASRHAVSVRPDPDFHRDMDRLIQAVRARDAERRAGRPGALKTLTAAFRSLPRWVGYASGGLSAVVVIVLVVLMNGRDPEGAARQDPGAAGRDVEAAPVSPAFPPVPSAVMPPVPAPQAPSKMAPASSPYSGSPAPADSAPPAPETAPSAPRARASSDAPAPPGSIRIVSQYVVPSPQSPYPRTSGAPSAGLFLRRREEFDPPLSAGPGPTKDSAPSPGGRPSDEAPPPPLILLVTGKHGVDSGRNTTSVPFAEGRDANPDRGAP